ncbi:MAG: von Willebrand factor type A domain-containing protein [Planctomycetes bacterium]|nr:von Willebrand factor type A domain-containing protein [Planctomycetota bacterium]
MKTRSKTFSALAVAALVTVVMLAACSSNTYESGGGDLRTDDSGGAENPQAGIFFNNQDPDAPPINFNQDIRGRFEHIYDDRLGNEPDGRPTEGQPYDEFWKKYDTNPFIDSEDDRLSTFAVDVDTGAYTKCRDYINRGNLPPQGYARVEEFVNYFDYGYDAPYEDTFAITMDAAPSRYGQDLKNCYLMRVGMQAKKIDPEKRKPANLTFVIDVSGSMEMDNRLGYVKKALTMLVKQLRRDDYVGIAVYGSRGRKVLSPTNDPEAIIDALDRLNPDGSTNAEEGIRIGYDMAEDAFREGSINRVILCTDGVANNGETQVENLLKMIERQRRKGITLSAIGFGMSNYNDELIEQMGDKGDGHYAYVDTLDEAKRIFVENLTGTLQVVARDTKVQVEFNPEVVKSWRLLGYENRDVADEDFRNDKVDGGEVGSGHSVTAVYELKLFDNASGPIGTATVRYKHDERDEFFEVNREIRTGDIAADWDAAPVSLRLAGNVAEFGEMLRKSYWAKGASYDALLEDVKKLIAETDDTEVLNFATLITKARDLDRDQNPEEASAGGD